MANESGGNPLHFEWTQAGEAALNRTLAEVIKRVGDLERAQKTETQAANQADRANQGLGRTLQATGAAAGSAQIRLSTFGSTLGLAAQGFGAMSSGGGRMVSMLGQATGAISSMSAAMGPWGIAIGLATTAFSLLSNATDRQTTQIRRQAEVIRETAIPALDDYISSIRRGLSEQERLTRVRSGQGSVIEQRAELERLRGLRQQAMGSSATVDTSLELLDAQIQAAEERLQGARGQMAATPGGSREETPAQAAERLRRERERSGGGGARAAEERQRQELADLIAMQRGIATDQRARSGTRLGTVDLQGQYEAEQERDQATIRGADALARRGGRGGPDRIEKDDSAAREHEAWEIAEGFDLAAESAERLRDVTIEVGDAFAEVLEKVLSGEENLGAAFLQVAGEQVKAVGYTMVAKGVAHVLEGTALLATLVTSGPGLALIGTGGAEIAQGSAFIAGGYLAAAGGKATSTAGGGGGGRSSGGRARPEGRAPTDSDSGGSRTIVINMGDSKVLMGTKPEIGRALAEAIESAQQRWG